MRAIRLWKPYGVLCQFTDEAGRRTLAEFVDQKGVYAAGRLDADSEGLLILTDDGALNAGLTDPKFEHEKTYWVQVEGALDQNALERLKDGVELKDGRTKKAEAKILKIEPKLPERDPPIRVRKAIPTTWIELKISEGKNRQVRRMTAAVGHPTLRLVRWAVGDVTLEGLTPGDWDVLDPISHPSIYKLRHQFMAEVKPANGKRAKALGGNVRRGGEKGNR